MDDGMGVDDGMGIDGEMDDWADGGGDDEFAMGGGGTGPTQELENRIDELENEVAEISSTVGTVRSENEQISSKVDETEENVRKLLEIYEMVTRGVNPFVDDVQQGGDAFGEDGGGFGLFEGDEEEEEEEDLDEDVADAEAESFFDDDFEEGDDFEEEAGDDLGFDAPEEGMDDADPVMDDGADAEDADAGQAGGSTFAELKEEYESGDADWAQGKADGAEASEPDAEPMVEAEGGTDEPVDGEFEFEGPADAEPTDDAAVESADAEPATTANSGQGDKPYLAELPNGYVSDLVVMEWLEFLVTEFGPEDAVRTVEYYGDIGWISESVEEDLLAFVSGFADVDSVETEETGPATLEIGDHIRSLTFLSRLTGDAVQRKIVEHCAQIRGGRDGIQR
jgi:flagellar protein FlaE/flagellar protein FlaC